MRAVGLGVAVLVLVAALGACGDDGASGGTGEDIYKRNCATCHGADGKGGIGKDLTGVADRLSAEQHLEVVREGRPPMPAFGGQLSDEEIRKVVEYERTQLNG